MEMPIHADRRWTVSLEYCGQATPQYVIRFCGDWVDQRATRGAAFMRAIGAKAARDGALTVTEERAPESRYPRLIRAIRSVCNLSSNEAAAAIMAHKRRDIWSVEAVNAYGGVPAVIYSTIKHRHIWSAR